MIIVRKATLKDAEIIATHLLLAMQEIVYEFIGEENEARAREFMLHFVKQDNNQYSYQNCWVAENDVDVIAAVNVYDGAHLHELRLPVIEYLKSNFNKNFAHEDETQAGEYYLDSLGVNPAHRCKGVGTRLLQFVIDEYVTRQKQNLGLLVEDHNPVAQRLYLRLGFNSTAKKVLFGKNMAHLQIKLDDIP